MKIAYLVTDPGIPVFGSKGASVHVRAFTSGLAACGHEVFVLAFNLDGKNPPDKRISYYQIGDKKIVKDKWSWLIGMIQNSESSDIQEKQPAGSIVTEIKKIDMMGHAVKDMTSILSKQQIDVLLERLSLFGGAGMMVSQKLGIPHIIEMNAPLAKETETWRGLYFKEMAYSIERRVLNAANGVMVVSEELKKILLKMGVSRKKILILPNGVDLNFFTPQEKNSGLARKLELKDKFVVGFSGSLKKWHGVDVLLEACSGLIKHIPELRLLIIGDGPEIEDLKTRAVRLNLFEKTRFTGQVLHSEIPDLIRLMDVAAAPYKTNGTFYFSPLKVIEYLACGLPVVTVKRGGAAFGISSGKNGILIDQAKPDYLGREIQTLFDDPDLRKKIAENATLLAEGRDWQSIAGKAVSFIEQGREHK